MNAVASALHPERRYESRADFRFAMPAVEQLMLGLARPQTPADNPVVDAVWHHMASGGQRTRARMGLHSASAVGLPLRDAVSIAAAVELLHNASLIHDDLQDGALTRRGAASVCARWGAEIAVCAGDLLISAAYACIARLSEPSRVPAILRVVHSRVSRVINGQADDIGHRRRPLTTFSEYKRIAAAKSGPLLALPVELALVATGFETSTAGPRVAADALAVAYQIADDLEDEAADTLSQGECLNAVAILRQSGKRNPRAFARFEAHTALLKAGDATMGLPLGSGAPLIECIDQVSLKLERCAQ